MNIVRKLPSCGRGRRAAVLATASVALAAALVVIGPNSPSGASGRTLSVGVDAPLTGGTASTGAQIRDAVQLAFDNVHDKVGNYKINLVTINDQNNPADGASALESAIARDHIQVVTGLWDSDVALADMPIVARSKIPFIFNGGSSTTMVVKVRKNPKSQRYWDGDVYPGAATTGEELAAAVNHYYSADPKAYPCGKTAATFAQQASAGYAVTAGAVKALKSDGWKILAKDYYTATQATNSAAIEGIEQKCVSAIIADGTATQAVSGIVNDASHTGFKGVLAVNGLNYSTTWYSLTGKNSNGVLDVGSVFLKGAKTKKFEKQFKQKFNLTPVAISAGIIYDYTNFLIKILDKTLNKFHSLTSNTIWKTVYKDVRTGKLAGSRGVALKGIHFSKKSWPEPVFAPNSYYDVVLQDENGSTQPVWPMGAHTAKFVQPGS